jgi:hypothetical protein
MKVLHFLNGFEVRQSVIEEGFKYLFFRMHDSNISVSNKGGRHHINTFFYQNLRCYITLELNPILKKRKMYNAYFNNLFFLAIINLIIVLGNKNNFLSKVLSLLILNSTIKRLKNFI